MSRIYQNKPLESLPVQTFSWQGMWDPTQLQSGNGVILEGSIAGRSRHVLVDLSQVRYRYLILEVLVSRAHRRQFDNSGKEVEPNFSETGKVRTGHLHSSYKTEAKGQTDRLSAEEIKKLLTQPALTAVTGPPGGENCIILWIEEKIVETIELNDGDEIRVKTHGNAPFVACIAKVDSESATVSNYAGGSNVGASWTDKVMAVKAQAAEREATGGDNEGADEDEWDD